MTSILKQLGWKFLHKRRKDINLPDFSSQALYQVKDSEYERHLRTLRQVQQKRVRLLWKSKVRHGIPKNETCTADDRTTDYEISWRKQTYSPDPPLCLTPVQKGYNNVTRPILKPKQRHVGVVRPVQYPESELDRTFTQPLTRSSGSSSPDTVRRLPPKKRPYVSTSTDSETTAKVIKRSITSVGTSDFNEYISAHVTDGYQCIHQDIREVEITAEDREVAEIMKHNEDDDNFKLSREYCGNNIIQEMDLDDREVDEIFQAEKYQENGVCNSPRESRVSCQTDVRFVSTAVQDNQTGSYFQSSDVQYSRDEAESIDEDGNTEAVATGVLTVSIEALREKVLNDSAIHKRVYDADKSKEEKFAELLEDFLAENEDLPPEIRNDILDMLTDVSKTVQEEKARQTAEFSNLTEYISDSNDDELTGEFERTADSNVILDESRTSSVYGYSEKQADTDLVTDDARKTSKYREHEPSAHKGLMLIAATEMPCYRESNSSADTVLIKQENTSDNSRTKTPAADTGMLTVATREKLEISNTSAETHLMLAEGNKISTGREFPGFDITETKPKFGSILDVSVEMANTGESIYNEIAAFFGYDGYGDFLTY